MTQLYPSIVAEIRPDFSIPVLAENLKRSSVESVKKFVALFLSSERGYGEAKTESPLRARAAVTAVWLGERRTYASRVRFHGTYELYTFNTRIVIRHLFAPRSFSRIAIYETTQVYRNRNNNRHSLRLADAVDSSGK